MSDKNMKNSQKEVRISFWASHITTIVSVTLVLLLGGIIAMIWTAARNEASRLRERLEMCVILADSIPDSAGERLASDISRQPYASTVRFVSREEALKAWTKDTGENLEEMFGVNPLSPEVSFTVKEQFADTGSLKRIKDSLEKIRGVESVAMPDDELVSAMNENIARLTVILGIVALVMLVISLVLINNAVHLAIYSRRFTIHTMQLVGATNGFIRRPVVLNNMLCGLISGLVAAGITALSLLGSQRAGMEDMARYLSWGTFGIVAGGMVVTGMGICALAAWVASTRYLRKDYDELFK